MYIPLAVLLLVSMVAITGLERSNIPLCLTAHTSRLPPPSVTEYIRLSKAISNPTKEAIQSVIDHEQNSIKYAHLTSSVSNGSFCPGWVQSHTLELTADS